MNETNNFSNQGNEPMRQLVSYLPDGKGNTPLQPVYPMPNMAPYQTAQSEKLLNQSIEILEQQNQQLFQLSTRLQNTAEKKEKELSQVREKLQRMEQQRQRFQDYLFETADGIIILLQKGKQSCLFDARLLYVEEYRIEYPDSGSMYVIYFELKTGQKISVVIRKDKFFSPALFKELKKQGVSVDPYLQTARIANLLQNFFTKKCKHVFEFPYSYGWKQGIYQFLSDSAAKNLQQLGFSIPYCQKYFPDDPATDASLYMKFLNESFEKLGGWGTLLCLTIGAGGLLYSELLSLGLRSDCVFLLEKNDTSSTICRIVQPWMWEYSYPLSKKNLEAALETCRDEASIFQEESTAYSRQFGKQLEEIVKSGYSVDSHNRTQDVKIAVLILTQDIEKWVTDDNNVIFLSNLFSDQGITLDKTFIPHFWKYFCLWLNQKKGDWKNLLLQLPAMELPSTKYAKTFEWLRASFTVLVNFLQSSLLFDMTQEDQDDFLQELLGWLRDDEAIDSKTLADAFIDWLNSMRADIPTIKLDRRTSFSSTDDVIYVASEFVYIRPDYFKNLVEECFSYYDYKQVYYALAETGYAKSDTDHVFPKVVLKSGARVRMAQITRSLIFSDSEFLLVL